VATPELEPLVDRVRDAIRDTERKTRPTFDDFAKDLRQVDVPQEIDRMTKAIQRIDVAKALERIELPAAIEQRLPSYRRKQQRRRVTLFAIGTAATFALVTIAVLPQTRRRARKAYDAVRSQVDSMRGQHALTNPVAFPAAETIPLHDDPSIPGSPAAYPDGLGSESSPLTTHDDLAIDRPLTETPR
jgi:hypothetical protein